VPITCGKAAIVEKSVSERWAALTVAARRATRAFDAFADAANGFGHRQRLAARRSAERARRR